MGIVLGVEAVVGVVEAAEAAAGAAEAGEAIASASEAAEAISSAAETGEAAGASAGEEAAAAAESEAALQAACETLTNALKKLGKMVVDFVCIDAIFKAAKAILEPLFSSDPSARTRAEKLAKLIEVLKESSLLLQNPTDWLKVHLQDTTDLPNFTVTTQGVLSKFIPQLGAVSIKLAMQRDISVICRSISKMIRVDNEDATKSRSSQKHIQETGRPILLFA